MAKKTNKTSHVMDLLTNGASPEVEAPANGSAAAPLAEAAGQEKAGDTQAQAHAAAPKVTVVDEGSLNDRLSQEILSNLSKELKEDTQSTSRTASAGGADAGSTAGREAADGSGTGTGVNAGNGSTGAADGSGVGTGSAAGNGSTGAAGDSGAGTDVTAGNGSAEAQDDAASPGPAATTQMDGMSPPVSPVGQTHHAIIPKSQISSNLQTGEYRFVNVMEQLMLRQDVASFQEQYNVCKCKRCTADVYALALTGLPSKYVVTRKDSLSPILSYYESKYKIFMLTELIKACNKVRESPRHKL